MRAVFFHLGKHFNALTRSDALLNKRRRLPQTMESWEHTLAYLMTTT
jgi:hypothetical protein